MLKLYLEDDKPENMIEDVEYGFLTFLLDGSEMEERLISKIEQGHIIKGDGTSFIDRFGYKLRTMHMSTGCKGALCVLHSNRCVSMLECGKNVQNIVITELRDGAVWIPDYGSGFYSDTDNDDIDVYLDSYRFTSLDRLNYYLNDERGLGIDLNIGGVECID